MMQGKQAENSCGIIDDFAMGVMGLIYLHFFQAHLVILNVQGSIFFSPHKIVMQLGECLDVHPSPNLKCC